MQEGQHACALCPCARSQTATAAPSLRLLGGSCRHSCPVRRSSCVGMGEYVSTHKTHADLTTHEVLQRPVHAKAHQLCDAQILQQHCQVLCAGIVGAAAPNHRSCGCVRSLLSSTASLKRLHSQHKPRQAPGLMLRVAEARSLKFLTASCKIAASLHVLMGAPARPRQGALEMAQGSQARRLQLFRNWYASSGIHVMTWNEARCGRKTALASCEPRKQEALQALPKLVRYSHTSNQSIQDRLLSDPGAEAKSKHFLDGILIYEMWSGQMASDDILVQPSFEAAACPDLRQNVVQCTMCMHSSNP